MALLHEAPLEWHEGEKAMHSLLHIPDQDNPTVPGLAPYGASITLRSPLLALGTLDDDGRPWTTLLGGEPAFTRPIGPSIIGVKTLVDRRYDPVLGILVGGKQDGEVNEQGRQGWMVSGLPIDLTTRNRVKLSGNMVAGAIEQIGPVSDEDEGGVGEVQLIIQVERSLGTSSLSYPENHIKLILDRKLPQISKQEADNPCYARPRFDLRVPSTA